MALQIERRVGGAELIEPSGRASIQTCILAYFMQWDF